MRLLLVEDKDSFRRLLLRALEGSVWEVHGAESPAAALDLLKRTPVEAIVTDLRLPGMSGLELIRRCRRFNPSIRILLMSAFGEPKDIVEAMRCGADDFLPKPFDLEFFKNRLEKMRALMVSPPPDRREPWVVASKQMGDLENDLRAVAETAAPALFSGPPGAGRSRAARRLHLLRHPAAPFHALQAHDLAAKPLSEPFMKDLAGGSLLIRDLEHLPKGGLPGLLRDLESHADLCWMGTCADAPALPEPLRARMGVFHHSLPPLAERREDIIPLFRFHVLDICVRSGRMAPVLGAAAERDLLLRPWPGNVAELVWVAHEALAASPGGVLEELPRGGPASGRPLVLPRPKRGRLGEMLSEIAAGAEMRLLKEALEEAGGDSAAAAESLGLGAKTFIHKLKGHGLTLGV